MSKPVMLKVVEVEGTWMYFAFPSQMAVNKFLDNMEQCQLCSMEWIGGERVAVKKKHHVQKFTIQTLPILTEDEFDAAKAEYQKAKELEEAELASEETVEAVQEEAGIPEEDEPEEKVPPGESDPRD